MKTAVEWLISDLISKGLLTLNGDTLKSIGKAKEMERERKISLLEWIRNNAVEVQGGWQYDNLTYTDKEILEVYYKQSKKQDQ
jgi:hypothetical protein